MVERVKDSYQLNFSDEDIVAGMREFPGYVDMTPGDFLKLYRHAYDFVWQRIMTQTQAKDLMTAPVVVALASETLENTIYLMARHHISGLPVVDETGRLVGVLSEKDILRHLGVTASNTLMGLLAASLTRPLDPKDQVKHTLVREAMSTPPAQVPLTASLSDIVKIFIEGCGASKSSNPLEEAGLESALICDQPPANSPRPINRLPVVDEKGQPVGIITRHNLILALSRML